MWKTGAAELAFNDYRPVKAGARFSTKWATPSLKSSLVKLLTISSLATSIASPSSWNKAPYTCRLMTRIERGEARVASSTAYFRTSAANLSCGITRLTRPMW